MRYKLLALLAVLFIYWMSVAYLVNSAHTDSKITYIYDDAYIHMGIAKNFVQQGVWGATPHEFTSTTSSPLWTLLIALIFAVVGVHETVPLIMNLIAGTALLIAVYRLLVHLPWYFILAGLLAIWLLLPLPFLTLSGMEHILHALLTVLYIHVSGEVLGVRYQVSGKKADHRATEKNEEAGESGASLMPLFFLTPLLVMTRYEGLFLVFTVGVLFFLLRRDWKTMLILGVLAAAPLLIYGAINVSNDWFWLPGSVLIKSDRPRALHGIKDLIYLAAYYPRHGLIVTARDSLFTMLMVFSVTGFGLTYRRHQRLATMLFIVAAITFFHMMFGAPFIRYYPYLIAAGLVPVLLTLYEYRQQVSGARYQEWGVIAMIGIFLVAPFADRGYDLLQRVPGAMTNIHDQQYQMALFVQTYYNEDQVAMNDIGTTSFLTDVHLLDLVGLGSLDVARKIVAKEPFGAAEIEATAQAHGTQIAIVYDAWYQIPPSWIPVGYWSTPSAGFLGSDTVTFYAVDPAAETQLIANLQAFSDRLPDRVTQAGKYLTDGD